MLLRIEIFLFLLSLGYSLYYVGDILFSLYRKSQQDKAQRQEQRKTILEKQSQVPKKPSTDTGTAKKATVVDTDRLRDIVKRIQVNKARGYYETARSLIVEGLTIDKNSKELNLELAEVYELEENYKNAEYIYRDMLESHRDNVELLKKLGNVLALQGNIEKSVQAYALAFEKKRDDIEIVDTLSNLYFDLKNFKDCLKFTKLFLKNKPRDIEKLGMKGYCLEKQGMIAEAIECYKKIIELQPYNMEMKQRVEKLQS